MLGSGSWWYYLATKAEEKSLFREQLWDVVALFFVLSLLHYCPNNIRTVLRVFPDLYICISNSTITTRNNKTFLITRNAQPIFTYLHS